MKEIWMAMAVILGITAIAVPLAAIALVSVASLREESVRSLSGDAPGPATRVARRLLGFRATPSRKATGRSWQETEREVRFAHARRTLPDPGEQPAGYQPQPGQVGSDQRQGAGV